MFYRTLVHRTKGQAMYRAFLSNRGFPRIATGVKSLSINLPLKKALSTLTLTTLLIPFSPAIATDRTVPITTAPPLMEQPFQTDTIYDLNTKAYNNSILQVNQPLHAYNQDLYEFSFKTFLEAENLNDAYRIADAAVKQNPTDLSWHERLAIIATWTQHPDVALKQWQYLAAHGRNDDGVLGHIIELSKGLHDDPALVEALKTHIDRYPDDTQAWEDLAAAYERLNQPYEAISLLQQGYVRKPNKIYLSIIAYLYNSIGEPRQEAIEINNIISHYGVTTDLALRQSEISYSQGSINIALKKLLAAKSKAKPTDYSYWRTLSDLAWIAQDYPDALLAAQTLYQQGQANADDYAHMINLLQKTNPEFAFSLSAEAWKNFHQPTFFFSAISSGSQLEKWAKLRDLYLSLSSDDKKQLTNNSYYWTTLSQVWQQLGNSEAAIKALDEALALEPDNIDIKVGYLWLLIDSNAKTSLARLINKWADLINNTQGTNKNPGLWDVFAYGALALGNDQLALKLFDENLPNQLQNYPWLISFAGSLEDADYILASYWARNFAWQGVQHSLAAQKTLITSEQWFPYAELSAIEAPGEISGQAMRRLAQYPLTDTNLNELLSWAVSTGEYDLATYLLKYYQINHIPIPQITELNVALNNNELPTMQRIITPSPTTDTLTNPKNPKAVNDQTGVNDQIEAVDARDAAVRLGQFAMAEQYAYAGMDQIQSNQAQQTFSYQLLAETMVAQANDVSLSPVFLEFGSVTQMNTYFTSVLHINANLSVAPFATYGPQWSNNKTQLTNVPTSDSEAGVNLNYKNNRNDWEVGASVRNDVRTFATARAQDSYQWNTALNLNLLLGYNQRSYLTDAMLVGGAQNMAQLTATYNLDNHNFLVAQEEGDEYVSQSGYNLGWGNLVNGEIDHRFTLDYPDIGVRAFGELANFAHTGTPRSDLTPLIPVNQSISSSFFIPDSFSQWGVGTYLGELYKDNYTSLFRPYFAADVFYNTVTHIGYDAGGGVAMRVFGDDQLAAFAEYSQDSGGVAQQTISVGCSYKYLF